VTPEKDFERLATLDDDFRKLVLLLSLFGVAVDLRKAGGDFLDFLSFVTFFLSKEESLLALYGGDLLDLPLFFKVEDEDELDNLLDELVELFSKVFKLCFDLIFLEETSTLQLTSIALSTLLLSGLYLFLRFFTPDFSIFASFWFILLPPALSPNAFLISWTNLLWLILSELEIFLISGFGTLLGRVVFFDADTGASSASGKKIRLNNA